MVSIEVFIGDCLVHQKFYSDLDDALGEAKTQLERGHVGDEVRLSLCHDPQN